MNSDTIFIIVSSIILVLIAFFIPKRLKKHELYSTSAFAATLGLVVDTILALKYKLYTLSEEGVQLAPIFGQVFLYTTASIIVLNFFPYNKSIKHKALYIVIVTILTLSFELIAYLTRFIRYNEWNLWYSAISYPILIIILVLNLKLYRRFFS